MPSAVATMARFLLHPFDGTDFSRKEKNSEEKEQSGKTTLEQLWALARAITQCAVNKGKGERATRRYSD